MIQPEQIFDLYGRPDPAVISQIEKNGIRLDYVGHAEITRILGVIDPFWTWEPLEIVNGRPAIHVHEGHIPRRDRDPIPVSMATMWGRLTLCGVTRIAVGSVEAHKPDLDKELVSDFLRNAAMRFGVALALWMKDDPAVVTPLQSRRDARSGPESAERHPSATSGPRLASDRQKDTIGRMAQERGYQMTKPLDALTSSEASELIDILKAMPKPTKPAKTDEEPF